MQRLRLRFGLDALSRHADPQALGQLNDGADNTQRFLAIANGVDEGSVDLQFGEGQLAQVAQARIASAEIVQRHGDAKIFERRKNGARALEIGNERILSDFDLQPLRRERALG